MSYEVISFDIFQTLVDVNRRIPEIWRGILKDQYTNKKAREGAEAVLGVLPATYENAVQSERFLTMAEVYQTCAEKAAGRLNFSVSPDEVAYHLMLQHSRAPFYPEVLDCMAKLRARYRIILSSDSSHLMVDGLIGKVPYEKAFISDDLKSYKGDPRGRFFNFVLETLDVPAEKIIHIGDSAADILGAHKAGIANCWINRDGRPWRRETKPDFVIRSFCDLEKIL